MPRGRREAALSARIGRLGVWNAGLAALPAERVRAALPELETLGYGAVWLPEGAKDALVNAGIVLAASSRLVVATAIANPWRRNPYAMVTGARTLGEAFPGRFVLGVGISHPAHVRFDGEGHDRPLTQMRQYLEAMDGVPYQGPPPARPVPQVLAALGPRMLALAAERSQGAHTYLVPVEHTAAARAILGPDPVLAVEQSFVLARSRREARAVAAVHLGNYLRFAAYWRNFRRLGFDSRDLSGSGSDRLLDAVVAIGGPEEVVGRIKAHLDAGADHVCIQPLGGATNRVPLAACRQVAGAMGLLG